MCVFESLFLTLGRDVQMSRVKNHPLIVIKSTQQSGGSGSNSSLTWQYRLHSGHSGPGILVTVFRSHTHDNNKYIRIGETLRSARGPDTLTPSDLLSSSWFQSGVNGAEIVEKLINISSKWWIPNYGRSLVSILN